MKAEPIAYLSVLLASTCCAVPVGLALLGLGVGSRIGPYHWYFTGAAIVLLAIAWGYFLREKRRARACACELTNERTTRNSLIVMSGVVAFFMILNVSAALGRRNKPPAVSSAGGTEVITLPVHGMSCVACEYPIESNLKKIDGVLEASASAAASTVTVKARRGTVSVEAIAGAVRSAGYEPDVSAARRSG
jgi:copper chaperone CopZ